MHLNIWHRFTWNGSQQTFQCVCSLRIGACNLHITTVQLATFLPSHLSSGMVPFLTIFTCNSPWCFHYPTNFAPVLALFIAYMYDRHYAPSTVSTYVSAVGYCHKLSGFPDPTKAFFIIQMLKGYGKLGSHLDSRLPITLPILHRILGSSAHFCRTPYDSCLFQAMCSLAFFACMWVGEITLTTTNDRSSRTTSPTYTAGGFEAGGGCFKIHFSWLQAPLQSETFFHCY